MTADLAVQADATFQQALALHQQSRLDEARALYEQTLERLPLHAHAWHLLGIVALQTQQFERARELIEKAISSDPQIGHRSGLACLRPLSSVPVETPAESASVIEPAIGPANIDNSWCSIRTSTLRRLFTFSPPWARSNSLCLVASRSACYSYSAIRGTVLVRRVELSHIRCAKSSNWPLRVLNFSQNG